MLHFKTSKNFNGMAKVQQRSEKITAFGGIFFVLDRFDRILSSVIDSHLGLRSKLIGYQYSEIIRAVFSVFCCGGDCMEDLNLWVAAGTDSGYDGCYDSDTCPHDYRYPLFKRLCLG